MATDKDAAIKRINDLSELARTAWFSLLAYLIFVGITLLSVKDADFFVPSHQTQLPLINVQIPTASFFWTAPIIGAALYTYLHLFLIKLWDAHGDARTSDSDDTHHWLVGDFILLRQRDKDAGARPLACLTDGITRLLIWIAGPFVLAGFWWRSIPAHDELLTSLIALCFWLSLVVGFTSWFRAERSLDQIGDDHWSVGAGFPAAVLCLWFLLAVGWVRTEGGIDHPLDSAVTYVNDTFGTELFRHCDGPLKDGEPTLLPDCFFPNGEQKEPPMVQESRIAALPFNAWINSLTLTNENWFGRLWLKAGERWTPLPRLSAECRNGRSSA